MTATIVTGQSHDAFQFAPWKEWLLFGHPAPLGTMALKELVADVPHEVVGCAVQLVFDSTLHLAVEGLQG